VGIVHGVEEPVYVLVAGHDAGQAQDGEGRVVGVHAHVHAVFLAGGHDGGQEVAHVLPEPRLVYALVEGEQLAEQLHGALLVLGDVAAHEALRLHDDAVHELGVVLGRERGLQLRHLGERGLVPVSLGPLALEDVDVEVGELRAGEIEVGAAVGVGVVEVGARPVQHGHEIVANGVDALQREVFQALLVALYLLVAVGAAILDALHHGERLHHAPAHAVALYVVPEVADALAGPHFAVGHVVQGGDDALHANLPQHGEGDLIALAKPSPSLFHKSRY